MEPNYLNTKFNLLFALFLFALIKGINCVNDNEPGILKFTNLSPSKVSGLRGKNFNLYCNGQDSRNEDLKYEWLFNGQPIKENDFRFIFKSNGTILEVRKLYIVIKNGSKSTGKFNCLISNSIGSILSRNIFLISTTRIKSSKKEESYKKVKHGENIRLLCPALSLTNDVWFSWLFNNEPLQETQKAYTLINSSVLHIVSASKSNEGVYTCIGHSQNQTSILKTHLRVITAEDDFKYIHFLNDNKTITNANNGQTVTLECLINLAKPDATITWLRLLNKKFFISNNKENNDQNLISTSLNKRRLPISRRRLITNSNDLNDNEIENSIDSNIFSRKRYSIIGESSLQIENVNQFDEDDYICRASYTLDEFNITDNTIHTLNVFDLPIQVKPVKETKIESFTGRKAKFDCGLIYLPKSNLLAKPTIKWLKNGQPIEISTRIFTKKDLKEHLNDEDHEKEEIIYENKHIKLDDLHSSQLVISSTIKSDNGYYQCFVENQFETITNEFYLYVNPSTNQPLPPKNIMVNIIGSNEAIVNWSVPMSLSEILGYTVHYHSPTNKKIKEEKVVTNNNFYHLTNLSAYTNYSLFVRAYSQQNASNDSKVINFLTGEETPLDLPFFRVMAKNKTTVLIRWEAMSSVDARGKILYYKIQYEEVNSNDNSKTEQIKTINVDPEITEYEITNLKPGSLYKFKVIAGNSKGLPSDDIIEYVDWEQIELPLVNSDQIRINLNTSSVTFDSIKVDWKLEEEDNEKDISYLIKNIKLTCQNTMKDDDKQTIELKKDQTTYEFLDLYEESFYMIEIEIQFDKYGLQFKEKTIVKTKSKPIPESKFLPEPNLIDKDDEINNLDKEISSNLPIDNNSLIINTNDNMSSSSTTSSSTTTTITPESISYSSSINPLDVNNSTSNSITSTESEFIGKPSITNETPTINRADIDFDPIVSIINEDNQSNLTDKQSSSNDRNENTTSNNTNSNNELSILSPNITDNLVDDYKITKPKLFKEEDKHDLNLINKDDYDEKLIKINENNLNQTNEITNSNKTIDNTIGNITDKSMDNEMKINLLIDSKILDKFNLTNKNDDQSLNFTKNDELITNQSNKKVLEQFENAFNSNQFDLTILNSTTSTTTSTTTTTTTEIPLININNKENSFNPPFDNQINNIELTNKNEETSDNQNTNNSIDKNEQPNEIRKRLDQITHNTIENNDKDQLIKNQTLNEDIKRENDLLNKLKQQDKQIENKFDNFDKIHNQTVNLDNQTTSTISTTTSTPSTTTIKNELDLSTPSSIQNRINQILTRNLTNDRLLPNINEFEVIPLNATTVNCKWKTNSLNDNLTFTIYYNPIKYLDQLNYSKNFDFDDEFLFLRTKDNEINITNLTPYTIYDFYITVNYKSNDNDEDFFYQLNKFLAKKLRNRYYVKHRFGFNQTDKFGKQQSLTKSQKKYEKQFRQLENVIEEFENLLHFFKGQRRRIRTLEDIPSQPQEFTAIALDSHSVQLSWRLPIEQNGLINAFEIYFTRNDDNFNLPLEEWDMISLDGSQFVHIIKSLNASTEYKFILKARNSAGLSKSAAKLIISTLKENYERYENFLTPEPDSNLDPNTFKYTKYEDMSYKDILSLNNSTEIIIRICIGIGCLLGLVFVMATCNRICTPSVPVKRCNCDNRIHDNCVQMNNYDRKGIKRNRNKNQSYLTKPFDVSISNSNQNVLIYSRQNSVNIVENNLDDHSISNSIQSHHQQQQQHQIKKEQYQIVKKNVKVEVHQTNSLRSQQKNEDKSINNLNQQQITKDEIINLNNNCLQSSVENNLNDQNLNCQLNTKQQLNGHHIEETELNNELFNNDKNSKKTFRRPYTDTDKELNLPLINQQQTKLYHEYDQPSSLYDHQTNNCCTHQNSILENGYSQSLNSNGQVKICNCNHKLNGSSSNNYNIENNDEIILNNDRRSLV